MTYSKFKVLLCITYLISFVTSAQDYSDTYTVSSYGSMNQDGAMLSNIVFEVGATNSYRWDDASGAKKDDKLWKVIGSVSLDGKLNGSGYVYKGVLYPFNDYSESSPYITLQESVEARIVLVNGFTKTGSFTMYSGAVLDGHSGEASVAHRLEDYQIQSVQITSTQNSSTERTIQDFLDKQSRMTRNSNTANGSDAYGGEGGASGDGNSYSTSSSSNSTKSTTSSSDTSNTSTMDAASVARNRVLAQQRAEAERARTTQKLASEAAYVIGGLSEVMAGVISDFRVTTDIRITEKITDEDGNDALSTSALTSYEVGIGFNRKGYLVLGYGFPESDTKDGDLWKVGVGIDVFNLAEQGKYRRGGLALGIEGELAFSHVNSTNGSREEDTILYGGMATLRLFEIFQVGYGYGFISGDVVRDDEDPFKISGTYSNFMIGLNIPF